MADLAELAARIPVGDSNAAWEMRHELEGQMTRVVRRALLRGNPASPLARRIVLEADRVAPLFPGESEETREQLVRHVAKRMCASVLNNLQPSAHRETVCN